MRHRASLLVVSGATLAACLYGGLLASLGSGFIAGDYPGPVCNGCDAAGPPIESLFHGNIASFFSTQPFMGSVSLLLRAPFVGLAASRGGGFIAQYRVGTLVCLLAVGLLLLPVFNLMLQGGQGLVKVLVVMAAILVGPATLRAIMWGHPEELLGAAFAVTAVLAAAGRRGVLAGILLGLALATKQWGVFAVLPVLMLARGQRKQVLLSAAALAAVFILPMLIGDPHRFLEQNFNTGVAQLGVTATNVWWVFHHVGYDPTAHEQLNVIPDGLRTLSHPLAVGIVLALSLLYWRRSTGRHPYDALQLLALLFLVRCLFDPLTISYHHAPFLLTLAVYEGLRARGAPVVTLAATAALALLASVISPLGDPNLMNVMYLAWGLGTAAYLIRGCFGAQPEPARSEHAVGLPPLSGPALVGAKPSP